MLFYHDLTGTSCIILERGVVLQDLPRIYMAGIILQPELLTWHDALTIAVIIFAITQFMETTRIRRYLFYLGWLRTITVVLVALPIILIIVANLPPTALVPVISYIGSLLGQYFSYVFQSSFSFLMPLLHDVSQLHISIPQGLWHDAGKLLSEPRTYEAGALSLFSILIFLYLAFLKNPHWFRPFFNTKLLDAMGWELLDNMRAEDLAALCKITGSYLEKIVSRASTVPRPLPPQFEDRQTFRDELAIRCKQFINVDLSGDNFIIYISRQNVKFIIWIIEYAKKYSFWNTGNSIFFDNLFSQLLKDKSSVLTREFKLGGYSGIAQPLSNAVFNSMEVIDNYDVFGALGWGGEVSDIVLSNTTTGLDMSLKKYFTTASGTYLGNPGMALGRTLEKLADCFYSMCLSIAPQQEAIWKTKNGGKMSSIINFYDRLQWLLTPNTDTRWRDAYTPVFSEQELSVQDYTVSHGIVEGFFKIIEGLSWLKNEEYARMELIRIYWLFYQLPETPVIKAIQDKLLEKIKERVEENFKNHYPSTIKLFLNLYGGELYGDLPHSNNSIALYFKEIFKSRIIPEIRKNKKFREHNMPTDWLFDKQNNIYRMFYDNKKIIIDKAPKKRGKPVVKKGAIRKLRKKK